MFVILDYAIRSYVKSGKSFYNLLNIKLSSSSKSNEQNCVINVNLKMIFVLVWREFNCCKVTERNKIDAQGTYL